MLDNRRLVIDSMSEIYNMLKPYADEEFWNFEQVTKQPGDLYVFGRQRLLDNLNQIRELAVSGNCVIVFDNSAEGAWTAETQLKQLRIDQLVRNGQILVVAGAELAPEYAHLTHEYFLCKILDFEENTQAQNSMVDIFSKTDKSYKFLCLNGRARPHRKYLYERLKRNKLLDQSLWTMLDSGPTVVKLFDLVENDVDIMATPTPIKHLPSGYEVDRYRDPTFGPIVNGRTNLKQELFNREWGEIYLEPAPYVDTYFSLVTETICAESNYSFRTEKIAKPLAIGHPFIAVANAGFYRDLHRLGFQTFGHVIDESFDQIENHQARVDRIVQIVADLCQQDLASFLKECYNVCKYNQQHLLELRTQVRHDFPNRFQQFIQQHRYE
jgi:hypothetical protein